MDGPSSCGVVVDCYRRLVSRKGGYVCLAAFTRAPQHIYCATAHTHHTVDFVYWANLLFSPDIWDLKSRGLATGWTELLRRGGGLVPSAGVLRKKDTYAWLPLPELRSTPCATAHTHHSRHCLWAKLVLPILGAEKQRSLATLDGPSSCGAVVACYRRWCLQKGDTYA